MSTKEGSTAALAEALDGYKKLVRSAQDVLTSYLTPDGYDADEAVALLLHLFDGPRQREVEACNQGEESEMKTTRGAVYTAIDGERAYQDAGMGNAQRHEGQPAMTPGEYILCMEHCLQKARETWYRPNGGYMCLPEIRKVTALGVAAMERYGAPLRKF